MDRIEVSAQQAGRDDGSRHWDFYADSARDNRAQDMRFRMILRAIFQIRQSVLLLMDVGSGQGDNDSPFGWQVITRALKLEP